MATRANPGGHQLWSPLYLLPLLRGASLGLNANFIYLVQDTENIFYTLWNSTWQSSLSMALLTKSGQGSAYSWLFPETQKFIHI